jgi:lysyl-tRNA synthetase, class I
MQAFRVCDRALEFRMAMTPKTKHWADLLAEDIIQQWGQSHVVNTGITPSGEIHIGNMREVVTADAIHHVLREQGAACQFLYIADTYDPLRHVYPFLDPRQYQDKVGRPLSEIPCPCLRHPSYSEHFLAPFLWSLEQLGITPTVHRADQLYKAGAYTETIIGALQQRDEIRRILKEETGRDTPDAWSPFNPICEACGRLTQTRVIGFSAQAHTVDYECSCGQRGTVSMAGGGKLTWRVDWPARWKIFGVTVEPFGKDHASKGGSYDTGVRIAREVYSIEPPFPIPYEWLSLAGRGDMSSSKGNVLSIHAMLEVVPPEVLRYLILRTSPQRSIRIDPGLPLLQLIDEYDDVEAKSRDSRAVELSAISGIRPVGVPYRHMVTVVQVAQGNFDKCLQILQRSGYAVDNVEGLRQRATYAQRWLETFAPEDLRFSIQEQLPAAAHELTPEQGHALKRLSERLQAGMSGEQIHQLIYAIKDELGGKPDLLFKAIYMALLGKAQGPRAGWFLSTLETTFVKQRFAEAAAAVGVNEQCP